MKNTPGTLRCGWGLNHCPIFLITFFFKHVIIHLMLFFSHKYLMQHNKDTRTSNTYIKLFHNRYEFTFKVYEQWIKKVLHHLSLFQLQLERASTLFNLLEFCFKGVLLQTCQICFKVICSKLSKSASELITGLLWDIYSVCSKWKNTQIGNKLLYCVGASTHGTFLDQKHFFLLLNMLLYIYSNSNYF